MGIREKTQGGEEAEVEAEAEVEEDSHLACGVSLLLGTTIELVNPERMDATFAIRRVISRGTTSSIRSLNKRC